MIESHESPPGETPSEARAESGAVLQTLVATGNLERLVVEARRFLSSDPLDFTAHYYAAVGLIDLERLDEAKGHLDFLFASQPDSVMTRYVAVHYFGKRGQWREVARQAAAGSRVSPGMALFHQHAALADLNLLRVREAKIHIDEARRLEPDNANIANLHITIHGVEETSVADAMRRLDEYAAALRLDPANAFLHHSMGRVCLDDLLDPVTAEAHFREALRLDPKNRVFQGDLFEAVARRSFLYRVFGIPRRSFVWLTNVLRAVKVQPWRILLLLIGFKLVLLYFAWLAAATLVFLPGAKAYEWLLVSEVRDLAAISNSGLRLRFRLHRLPGWLRFLVFLAVNALCWIGLFAGLKVELTGGFLVLGGFILFHALVVAAIVGTKRSQAKAVRKPGPPGRGLSVA